MSIYSIAQTKFLSDIEQGQKFLSNYEMFTLFLDSMPKHTKKEFLEDIKDELKDEGYFIIKPTNLAEQIKLEEIEETLYPYLNQRAFL
jgi:hypothetical protein